MGLGFSHSDAHWSYSGFNRFRSRLATEIGINLSKMRGFGDGYKSWDNIKDPIVPLLNHSDCDGKLGLREMKKIAPRLRELVELWGEDDWDRKQALILARDMEQCVERKIQLEFC